MWHVLPLVTWVVGVGGYVAQPYLLSYCRYVCANMVSTVTDCPDVDETSRLVSGVDTDS